MEGKKGYIQVYTGEGKGKTTAALGLGLRAAGQGFKVLMIQFMKGRNYGECKAVKNIPGFTLIQRGRDTFVDRENPAPEDIQLAEKGWQEAQAAIQENDVQLLILDEFNVVLDYQLLPLPEVLQVLEEKPTAMEIILTGRSAPLQIIELAHLVSEIQEVKHYYPQGVQARRGIEY